ncbi:hypothetical protein AcW1_001459 [Taiwanofungus camphoratus]|nr:hypothetical protein AcW2_000011 [Antrodia cinnamomea]KAI0964694.1 hypothetical protein AcW1_001459 [Antrodia cinnamomea]
MTRFPGVVDLRVSIFILFFTCAHFADSQFSQNLPLHTTSIAWRAQVLHLATKPTPPPYGNITLYSTSTHCITALTQDCETRMACPSAFMNDFKQDTECHTFQLTSLMLLMKMEAERINSRYACVLSHPSYLGPLAPQDHLGRPSPILSFLPMNNHDSC